MLNSFDALDPAERIIVALDCSFDEGIEIAKSLQGKARWVKVGMTMYYAEGPKAVQAFKDLGFKVFVDLKFHDIPHQIEGAARNVALTGADMMTMHAVGGVPMMQAAVRGVTAASEKTGSDLPVTLAITVLTSMDAETLAATGVVRPMAEQVVTLAGHAKEAGLSGVVASPQEAAQLREALGPDAYIVTPGVRPAGSDVGDQSRIATPAKAIVAGASHLVIGRPITQAEDRVAAFEAIAAEVADALK